MTDMERMHRLLAIAEHDEIFQIWKKSSVELEEKCVKIARWLPKKFRNIFSSYIEFKTMAYQRTLNIACQNMKFLDEKD